MEVLDEAPFGERTQRGYTTNFAIAACKPLRLWAFIMENGNMAGS